MDLVHKVFAYITHANRLLIFDHVDFPDGVPELSPGHDAFLPQLLFRMKLT